MKEFKCYACSKIFALSKSDEISKQYLFSACPSPEVLCEKCFGEFQNWRYKEKYLGQKDK